MRTHPVVGRVERVHDLRAVGHLKYRASPLWIVILANWGIAFFEYCLQVPANRIGYGEFSAGQLKTIQEVITLEAADDDCVATPATTTL